MMMAMVSYRGTGNHIILWGFFLLLLPFHLALVQKITNLPVHKVALRQSDPQSPFCYAVSSSDDLTPQQNFLATQVWPSARAAAHFLQQHCNPSWIVCELGCGPGLPSLTAAKMHCRGVIATDLDKFALELVQAAATEQGMTQLTTDQVDLRKDYLPLADLYVLSDVFESAAVAKGAAVLTKNALERGARVWVFAQTDRAQREVYLEEIKSFQPQASWIAPKSSDSSFSKLLLLDVNEELVQYN